MNPEYARIIAARDEDRRALFAATARRIGTTEQNIDKEPLKAGPVRAGRADQPLQRE
jgi:hypothetical protein